MREQYFRVKEESFEVLGANGRSIAAEILHYADDKTFVLPDTFEMPDKAFYEFTGDHGEIHFAPAFFDGVYLFEMARIDKDEAQEKARSVYRLFIDYAVAEEEAKRQEAYLTFYKRVSKDDTIEYMEEILQAFDQQLEKYPNLGEAYEKLAFELLNAHHRGALKFGIYMMLFVELSDKGYEFFEILGGCEELSYPISMLLRYRATESDNNERLFRLAKRTGGWARVFYIYSLNADNKEKREWLIAYGLDNGQERYLARMCEEKGEMHDILSMLKSSSDMYQRVLYNGAGKILQTFIDGKALSTPNHLKTLLIEYLRVSQSFCHNLSNFYLVAKIFDYFQDEAEDVSENEKTEVKENVIALFTKKRARSAIREGLKGDPQTALELGKRIGMKDLWEELFMIALSDSNFEDWYALTLTDDIDEYKKLCAFAEGRLPLDEIATGVSDELGLEEKYAPHMNLLMVIQNLDKFTERFGEKLIKTALKSPVVNNRNMALRMVLSWDCVPDEICEILTENYDKEPNDDALKKYAEILGRERC
ncbi:MAG: hypothetical protein QG564_737 [Campylobacterota bacterium]|nr:hypothetical protein [Campylobacterota bacterium]